MNDIPQIIIFNQVLQVRDNLGTRFPEWSGRGYQIVGFAWHQGFNNRVRATLSDDCKDNLPDLISDIRAEFGMPDLPFVIAAAGIATGGLVESPLHRIQQGRAGPALGGRCIQSGERALLRHPAIPAVA